MSFELFVNVSMESDDVHSSTGSLFHVAGPDTAKLRRPMVVLVPGTTSVPLFADRSCQLPTTDETVVQTSASELSELSELNVNTKLYYVVNQ